MDFAELQTEVYARGLDYLNQDAAGQVRVKRWINQAYLELCGLERWPFLAATETGAAPLTISDLGTVESVRNSSENSVALAWRDRRDLTTSYSDLTTTGSPRWFYIDNGVIRTWPVGGSLTVLYWKVPAELEDDDDEPAIPARFQDLIVDGAVIRAYKDSDNFDFVQNLRAEWERGVETMRQALLDQQDDSSSLIQVRAGSEDW